MFSWLWPPITWRKSVLVVLALSAGIYVVLALANISPPKDHCAWAFPKVLSCLLAARENLSGGLIGAGGALIAAWVAWSAIYEQMTQAENIAREQMIAQREIAERNETQALNFIKSEIESILDLFQVIWRMVIDTVKFKSENEERRALTRMTAIFSEMCSHLPTVDTLDYLESVADKLGPRHRSDASRVIWRLKVVFREIDACKQAHVYSAGVLQLWRLQTKLSWLNQAVRAFDVLDATKLRTYQIDAPSPANALQQSYEKLLDKEAQRRPSEAEGKE